MTPDVEGLIVKGIGGFYFVETPERVIECRARGILRKSGTVPMAGDHVEIRLSPDGTGFVEKILPRRNFLLRPPVANINQLVIVVSTCEPSPNALVIDRMIAGAEAAGIEPVVAISKVDLQDADSLSGIYRKAGLRLFCISSVTGQGVDEVEKILAGKITAFTGNSGVGKSTLLNRMFENFHLQTGEISRKLGRGRHTTRRVELLKLEGGGYVIDTPGFSSLDSSLFGTVTAENLACCFREFVPFLNRCRFTSCSHTCEEGCAVIGAVEDGIISRSRHESYKAMYREMKESKKWRKKERFV
ncbi:MAG: ribosome small subunit-dependent GTPase A [Oscillospiraceae bacterium]|jgi:ribosome biogenesis GTPase|nr:ribosome small subunit-dependent GTPase A [Oscillospiraceae bacterium]MCI2035362.1 ribosome small subunit-dependent GTPase A [Oscillospiraceae bacterium]